MQAVRQDLAKFRHFGNFKLYFVIFRNILGYKLPNNEQIICPSGRTGCKFWHFDSLHYTDLFKTLTAKLKRLN